MIKIFETLYSFTLRWKITKGLFASLTWVLFRGIINTIIPYYYNLTCRRVNYRIKAQEISSPRIIVSFTSFPKRIDKVWLVVESILRQSYMPDLLILWLSKKQFPTAEHLPRKLKEQLSRGLQIEFVEEDIKSYKKIFYCLKNFPNDIIITIDDDIFYGNYLIESLMNLHTKYNNAIISAYTKQILNNGHNLYPYSSWPLIKKETKPGFNFFYGTGGGTLFPPHSLDNDVFKKDTFLKLAPTADDIWINAMSQLKGTPVVSTGQISCYFPININHNNTLDSINNGKNQNDVQISMVINYYQESRLINPFQHFNEDA